MLPAAAAELPIEAYPVRPVLVVFRWTGVYAGVHLGGASGYLAETPVPFLMPDGTVIAPLPASLTTSGGLAGGQIGANYQVESWVLGIEGQASWANLTGSTGCVANGVGVTVVVGAANCTAKIEYNYMDLGNYANRFADAFAYIVLDSNTRERVNVVKIGVNYRIGVSPILIK